MKIQVRIHNSEGHVRTVNVPTGKKITTFITPEEGKFNYELIDLETGAGPQSITAKRQGNDLAVTFENADQPDLIFENYYAEEEPSLIIGLAEDGHYYAYIPESGMGADAIPNLNEAVLASEVLGGERVGLVPFVFPFWTSLLGGAVALAAAGVVAGVASGSSSKKLEIAGQEQPQQPETPRVLPTPNVSVSEDRKFIEISVPTDRTVTGDKLVIGVVEKGNTTPTRVELTKNSDGSWTSNNQDLVPNIDAPARDANGNVPTFVIAKIDASKVEPDTDVTAIIVDKDGKSGEQDQDKINLDADNDPLPPVVTSKNNGDVDVTVPEGLNTGDKVVVQLVERGNYQTDENGNVVVDAEGKPVGVKTLVELVKQEDGSFLSSNPDLVPSIPTGERTSTIDGEKIEPGSTVDAETQTVTGKVSPEATAPVAVPDEIEPNDPIVTPKAKGSIEVALPAELDANDNRLEISVLETGNTERTLVTLTKDAEGNWVSSNPELIPTIPAGEKATLIDGAKIDDVAPVTAQLFDAVNNKSAEVSGVPDNSPPPAPTVNPIENGKVEIIAPQAETTTGDKLIITVQEPDKDEPTTIVLTRKEDGSWESNNTTIVPSIPAQPDADGKHKTVIDSAYIKPGTEVKAVIEDVSGNQGTEDKAEPDTTVPDAPIVTPNEDGSVTITLPESAKDAKKDSKLEVTVTRPDGTTEKVTLVADGEGNWTSDKPNIVPSISAGSDNTTIPANQIRPGSQVTAQIIGPTGNQGQIGQEDAIEPDLTTPQKPEVTANPDGSVEVKVPANAKEGDKVEVTITKPNGEVVNATLTKQPDGSWSSSNPRVLPPVDENANTSTIPASELPPGSEVKAVTISKAGVPSEDAKDNAVEPVISPVLEAETDPTKPGALVIKPEESNTKLEVTFIGEDDKEKTLVVEKDPETNEWTVTTAPDVPVIVDKDTGAITIEPNSIKDGSNGTVVATSGSRPSSEPKPFTAPFDAPSDTPVVSAGTEPGSVIITPGANNDRVRGTYTGEDEVERTFEAEKGENGWVLKVEPTNNGATIDPVSGVITLPSNSLKDNSPVSAQGQNGNDPWSSPNEASETTAGSDIQSPAPKVAQDPANQGGMIITPTEGNTKVTVTYTDEQNREVSGVAELKDGVWSVVEATRNGEKVEPEALEGMTISPEGVITLAPNAVQDESTVSAVARSGNNPESAVARALADKDPTSSPPTVVKGEEPGSIVITPGKGNTEVLATLTDENDVEENIIASFDPETQTWSLIDEVPGVSIDEKTGVITISADAVKDGSTVSVTGVTGNDPESAVQTVVADKDPASNPPTVTPLENGGVEVTPGEGNDRLTVDFTDEDNSRQKIEVAVEKNEDGIWVPTHDLPQGVHLDPNTGKVTLDPNVVKDNTPVTATGQSGNNDPVTTEPVLSKTDTRSLKPEITAGTEPGSVVITPEKDNTKVNVTFTDENNIGQAVEITKNSAGQWVPSTDLPKGVTLNRDTGVITLTPDSVKDDAPVTATGTSGDNPASETAELPQAGKDAPSAPPVVENGSRPGSVEVTPNKDNTELTVKYTSEEQGNPEKEVTVKKNPETGRWEPVGELPKDVSVNPDTGRVTLGPDAVLDGRPVTAIGTSGNNDPTSTDGTFVAGTDPVSPAPTVVEGSQPGSIEVIPATGNTKVVADFTGEDNLPKHVEAEINPQTGLWELKQPTPEGVGIDPNSGRITIAPNAVKDGTPVKAQGQNGNNPISPEMGEEDAVIAPDDVRSQNPAIASGREPGSILVEPNPENTKLSVTFTPEATEENPEPKPQTLTIEKKDGQWELTEGVKPEGVEINPVSGRITIPADNVKDMSEVTAVSQTGNNPPSETIPAQAGNDSASPAPRISAGSTQGSVNITPHGTNDKVEVKFHNEKEPSEEVTVTATATTVDGKKTWALTNNPMGDQVTINPETGVITLTPDAVKDGSEVIAKGTSGNNPESAETKGSAQNDAQSATPIASRGEEPGSLVVTPGEGNDKVTVKFTGEDDNPKEVVAEKDPQGNWTLKGDTEGVSITPEGVITISPDAIKDNTPAEVTGQKGNDPASTTTTTTTTTDAPSEQPTAISAGSEPGSVEITPHPENTEVTVKFTDENGDPKEVTFTKDPQGNWVAPADAPEGVKASPDGQKIILEPNAVKDTTPVAVTAKSGENPSSVEATIIAGLDAKSTPPQIAKMSDANQGGVTVTPVEGNTKLIVDFTDENNVKQTVEAELKNGTWTLGENKPAGVSVHPTSGVLTLSPNSIADETEVYAKAQNGNNPVSDDVDLISDRDPRSAQPSITGGDQQGSVKVVPAENNTAVEVTYTDENGNEVSFRVEENAQGVWAATEPSKVPNGVMINAEDGTVTIPANNIRDDSNVFAIGQDGNNDKSAAKVEKSAFDAQSEKPTVAQGTEPGSFEVTPNAENTRLVIEYTDENNAKRIVDVEKNDAGQWVPKLALPDGVKLENGKVILPADILKDGTPVDVKGQDGNDPLSGSVTNQDGSPLMAQTDATSTPPTIAKGEVQGSAVVTPGEGNTRMTVTYKPEEGNTPVTIQLLKDANTNQWSSSDRLPDGVVLNPATGELKIANENLLDKAPDGIVAVGQKNNDPVGRATFVPDADPDSPAPTVVKGAEKGKEKGSVVITPAEGNTEIEISFFPEGSSTEIDSPVIARLEDNVWKIVSASNDDTRDITIDPISGEIFIPADLLNDGEDKPVIAMARNGSNPRSPAASVVPGEDAQSDKPTITAGTEPGSVVIAPHAKNTTLEVEFEPTTGAKQTVRANKEPTGEWVLETPVAGVNVDRQTGEITISGPAVKDNSPVTAFGINGNNPKSEPETGRAGNDNASPAPTISAGEQEGAVVITPERTNDKLTVDFTDEKDQPKKVELEKVGTTWKLKDGTTLPDGVEFDPQSGKVTLSPNAVKDETPVKAVGQSPSKDPSAEVSRLSGVDERSPTPEINNGDELGEVVVTPKEPSDKLKVNYIDEAGVPHTIELNKVGGQWTPKEPLPAGVTHEPATGKVTLSPDSVRDFSKVTATAVNGDSPESLPAELQARADGKSDIPTIVSIFDPEQLATNSSKFKPELGELNRLSRLKLKVDQGIATPQERAEFNALPESRKQEIVDFENNLLENQGGAFITPHENNTAVVVRFRPEGSDTAVRVTVRKDLDSNLWSVVNSPKHEHIGIDGVTRVIDSVTVDPASGKITLHPNAVEDGSTVQVFGINGNNPESDASDPWIADPDRRSDQPTIVTEATQIGEGAEQGSVAVIPHPRNTRETIAYVDENNQPQSIRTSKNREGKWVFELGNNPIPAGVTLDPETGKVVIPANGVRDVSDVRAVGKNGNNPDAEEVTGKSTLDKESNPPTIEPGSEQGSVVVKPNPSNVMVEITYRDEARDSQILIARKDAEGRWAFNNNSVPEYVSIDPRDGTVTIRSEGILDPNVDGSPTGSKVTATARDGYPGQLANENPVSIEVSLDPNNDAQSPQPSLTNGREEGSVIVGPGEGNTDVDIQFTNEDGRLIETKVRKNITNGQWAFEGERPAGLNLDVATGRVTISPDAVQDLSTVRARGLNRHPAGIDSANPISDWAGHTAPLDKKSGQPTIFDNQTDEKGSVIVTPHSANERMVVTYKNEANEDVSVTVAKNGTSWRIEGQIPANVRLEPSNGALRIAADGLKDGETIRAIGFDPARNPESDPITLPAPTDRQSDAPVIANGTQQGSVTVTPVGKNTTMTVTYRDENDQDHTVKLEKVGRVWRFAADSERPAGVSLTDTSTGRITIAADSLKDGSDITAQSRSGDDPISEITRSKAGEDARSPAPSVSAQAGGSVDITPHQEDTFVKVNYIDETAPEGQPKEIAIAKDQQGQWQFVDPETKAPVAKPEGVELNAENGVIHLEPNSVRDNSLVTAVGQKGNDPLSAEASATAGPDKQSEPPVVSPVLDGEGRGTVVVVPDPENTMLTVNYFDENSPETGAVPRTVKAEKVGNEWRITEGASPLIAILPESGAIILSPNAVKDGSTVTAQSQTNNDPISEERTGVAALDAPSPMPSVTAGEVSGSVVITPHAGDRPNTQNTINYRDEANNPQLITTQRGPNGRWTITAGQKEGITIDERTGAVTIAPNNVADNSQVTATGISGNDPRSATATGTAGIDPASPPPTITPVETGANKGAVEITPNVDNATMTVKYRDEKDQPHDIVATKNPQGQWVLTTNPDPQGVSIDPRTGKVTIAPESVLDRSQVTATGQNASDPVSPEVQGTAPEDAQSPAPTVARGTSEKGSMVITPATGNTANEIKFKNENGADLTINTMKDGDEWHFVGEAFGARIDERTGEVTLPADLVLDGSEVTATGENGTNPRSTIARGTADEDAQSPRPTVTPITSGENQGAVEITPAEGNTRETITFQDENDRTQTVVIQRNSAGIWSPVGNQLPDLVTLDRSNGKVTIAPNGVKDLSNVTAVGQNGNNKESEPAVGQASEDQQSPRPTIGAGSLGGSVNITPATGNTENTITYRDEVGRTHTVNTRLNGTTWEIVSVQPADSGVSINPNNGVVTLAPNSVEDGSKVTATGVNGNNPRSLEAEGTAGSDTQSPAPVISATAGRPGSVTVTPNATNTKASFTYRDENDGEHTVNLQKNGDTWVVTNAPLPTGLVLNPTDGSVVIDAQAIKDESAITAFGQNGNDPVSGIVNGVAGIDPKSPAPAVNAGREPGSVTVEPATGNTKETITFTDENGVSYTVLTEKTGDNWAITSVRPTQANVASNPQTVAGVSIDRSSGVVTISPETVQDNSQVTAVGQNGNDPVSDLARGTAGSDAASPVPTFSAGTEQGSVVIRPGEGNTRVSFNFNTEQDRPRGLVTVKENGQWRFEGSTQTPVGVQLDRQTGEITIAADSVRDTSIVTATGQNGNNPASATGRFNAPVDKQLEKPLMELGTEPGSITITPVEGTATTVRFTDEADNNRTIRITKGANGRWAFNGNNFGAQLDQATGKITIPAENIKDRTTATAFSTGTNPQSENATIQAPLDAQSPRPTITANPNEQGSVIVTPGEGNTRNTINYINEVDTNRTQTINTVKNGNVWSFVGNSNGFTIDSATGAVTIPANSLLDNSKVTATGQNGNNPISAVAEGTAPVDARSPAPTITPTTSGANQGQVTVTPAAGNTKNTINYTDEAGNERVINTVRDGANWRFDGNSFGATINRTTGAVTIPAEGVRDQSRVTATGQNGNDPISETRVGTAPNDPQSPPPTVSPIASGANQGAVEITPANGNTRMTVNFTTEGNTPRALTVVRDGNNWRFEPAGAKAGATVDANTGKITLAPDSVLDGSTVTATGQNGNNPVSTNATGVAPTDARSPAPSIDNGEAQGSVDINPGAGNTRMTVNFVDENGNNRVLNATKTGNNWALTGNTFGATINTSTGEITIPAQGIRDLSLVTATGQNGNNPVSINANGTAPADPKSPAPVITLGQGEAEGSVDITPVAGNTSMTVKYTNEQNQAQEVNVARNTQGNWAFVGSAPAGVTVDARTGKVTLPANAVKDNARVEGQSQNTNDPISDVTVGFAGNNPIQAEKLRLALRTDSGRSSSDRITNDGRVFVDGIPDGQAWEYSINGGATWIRGGVGGSGREFLDLPTNGSREGVAHSVKARLSGSDRLKQITESDNLNVTYDHIARPVVSIDPNGGLTTQSVTVVGNKESGATLAYRIGRLNPNTTPLREIEKTAQNASFFPDVGFEANYMKTLTDRNGINGYQIVETDVAGNVGETALPTFVRVSHLKGGAGNWGNPGSGRIGTSGNDVLVLDRTADDKDGLIKNGNMDTGARVNLGDGDDIFYMAGTMYANTYVHMGAGNDYFNVNELAALTSPVIIDMESGNDNLVIRTDYGARNYAVFGTGTRVDLGSGDDTITVQGNNWKFASPGAHLSGGDGYDTLIAESGLRYATRADIEYRELHAITGFEKLIMRKTGSFLIDNQFLQNNHDSNNVFTIEGTGVVHVTTGGHSIRGTVSDENHTYQVVNTSSGYTLMVEQGIQVL